MTIKKIGTTKLETSAYYQPIGNTGIKFWNMDSNTSILQFQITRNNIVLPLGLNNVIAYITLIASDGSHLTDTLEIIDELKGILSYQIPNDFLMHTGTVQGQVYISVNNTEETVTEAEFIFEIEDALINKITSDIKIKYIRIFDDLKKDIEKKIKKIIADIDSGDDYVTAIQNVSIDATTKINAKYDDLQTRFDNLNPSQLAKKTGDTFTGSLQFDGVPTIFQAKQNNAWWYRLTSENSTTYQQSLFPTMVSGINGVQGSGYNFKQAYLKLNNVDVETVTGSQTKADKALNDAKSFFELSSEVQSVNLTPKNGFIATQPLIARYVKFGTRFLVLIGGIVGKGTGTGTGVCASVPSLLAPDTAWNKLFSASQQSSSANNRANVYISSGGDISVVAAGDITFNTGLDCVIYFTKEVTT